MIYLNHVNKPKIWSMIMSKKILIIEDEFEIQEGLKSYLENENYQVDVASDGLEGAYLATKECYDLILLDVMLPKMDGFAVLELIRKDSAVPVIMLTALGEEENQLKGFNLQIDDYIIKPFAMSLVLKRIEAVLRRSETKAGVHSSFLLVNREISLNPVSCEVVVSSNPIMLTNKEYELLHLFMKEPNRVFTRDELLDHCWGHDFFGNEHVVSVHIGNLRQKLGNNYIQTVRGRGYKLVTEKPI